MARRCEQTKQLVEVLSSLGLRSKKAKKDGMTVYADYRAHTETRQIAGGTEYGAGRASGRSERFDEVVGANIQAFLDNHISVVEYRSKDGVRRTTYTLMCQWNAVHRVIEY